MTESKAREDIADRKRPVSREADRKARVPLHLQQTLSYFDREPGFTYRFVNDNHGRISNFLKAGWEIVEGDSSSTFSGKGREVETQKSSQVWRTVNRGTDASTRDAVLMKIPTELYEEDQTAKVSQVAANEARLDPDGKLKSARRFGSAGSKH